MTVMPKPPVKTVTSREFNQNTSEAKRAATQGPVFVTDRGLPAYVLLSIEEYRRLTTKPMSLAEALEQKGAPDFDIDLPQRSRKGSLRTPDLS